MPFYMYQRKSPACSKDDEGNYKELVKYEFEFSDGETIWHTEFFQEVTVGLPESSEVFKVFEDFSILTCEFEAWKRIHSWKPPKKKKVDNQDEPLT